MSNKFRIDLLSKQLPATFTAYDILYYDDKQVTDLPLMERKELLKKVIRENERIAISRYIEEKGIALYNAAEQNHLEGIVAKRKDSKYYFDKRTKDWIKIKYLKDDDYVVCGYVDDSKYVVSLIIGQYDNKTLVYRGNVTLGKSREEFRIISTHNKLDSTPFNRQYNSNDIVWISPDLVCTVKYMEKSLKDSLRQPVFKMLRDDKNAEECAVK